MSIFREAFVKGLKGEADLNKDTFITGSELSQFIETIVVDKSHGDQTPWFGRMPISRYRSLQDISEDMGDIIFFQKHK